METALLVQSSAGQTHTGSHRHVLHLPTVVPNEQQMNQIRSVLLHLCDRYRTLRGIIFAADILWPYAETHTDQRSWENTILFDREKGK